MELIQLLWERLQPTKKAEERVASLTYLEELYAHGVVDTKKWSLNQWKLYLQTLPQEEGKIIIHKNSLPEIQKFLVQGKLRRPFDPTRLKDGLRTPAWLEELYSKVLLFETSLTQANWKNLCQKEITPQFSKGEKIQVSPPFKDYLLQLLEKHSSPRRKLEQWYHQPDEIVSEPASTSGSPTPIRDSYIDKPIELLEKKKIDKLYYHYDQQPQTNDEEDLYFLEELAKLEKEDDEEP